MASQNATQKFGANVLVVSELLTGGSTVTLAAGIDMRDYNKIGVLAAVAALAGAGMTKLEIIASASANMGTPAVIKDSGTIAADAVDDQAFEECTASEIAQAETDGGVALRYASPRVTLDNTSDAVMATMICEPRVGRDDLTPATTIAE